ncbi:FHA domain-containing protein [Paenibacillus sp. UNCCL117]|uniref:DUF6382 domain-containing protein n=1 Tax=unclassified Paenibacillus TaxID=185978 RepID=UPI00088713FD|nr:MULTISPECIES: DUF6382 domain-containing protein [unclassified Paenibacillus]SDC48381.1 FHA domain-containing protein [Paenibacillus sp. cl123]SFW11945.1 FHA domain-containing protein [Paenibacillus sp. UNCCL117]
MSQPLYGLRVEFVKQYGHDMAIYAEEGLKRDMLSEFQLRMLAANRIPSLLELKVEAKDGNCTLYYNIAGKRMLSQLLRMEPISMKQYYTLLLQIAEVLADSAMHMLQPGRFVLKEDFMFCAGGLDQLYLTYLPKEQLEGKNSVSADLLHLASRWIHRVSELQGGGFQELMRYLQEETFNVPELKQLLHRQLDRLAGAAAEAAASAAGRSYEAYGPGDEQAGAATQKSQLSDTGIFPGSIRLGERQSYSDSARERPAPANKLHEAGSSRPLDGPLHFGSGLTSPYHPAEPKPSVDGGEAEKGDAPRFRRLPVALGMILAISLLWKLYADQPEEELLYVCAGGSLVIVAAGFGLLRMKAGGGQSKSASPPAQMYAPPIPERSAEAAAFAADGTRGTVWPQAGVYPERSAPLRASPLIAEAPSYLESIGLAGSTPNLRHSTGAGDENVVTAGQRETDQQTLTMEARLDGRTTMLRRPDATVVLSQTFSPKAMTGKYLELRGGGKTDKIWLDKKSFVIGRQGAEAAYVLDEMGVSRLHAEIVTESEIVTVKDLGSSNGTWVNGELLIPYQGRRLNDGDTIRIVTTEFIFKN